MRHPPVVDVGALVDPSAAAALRLQAARAIDAAARSWGFFYAANHGVDRVLLDRTVALARAFFAQDEAQKMRIPMSAGGLAWRGYFPAGDELTSGRPDWKEGLYLGSELPADHPRVRSGVILHGPNLWPAIPAFPRDGTRVHRGAFRTGAGAHARLRARPGTA